MDPVVEQDPHQYKTTGVAARVGDLAGLQQMVWNSRPVDVFDNRGWSPLHEAAYAGFSGCVEFLLRQPEIDPDWQTHRGETAMLLAAHKGNTQCLRCLMNARADLSLPNHEGFTPLFEAVRCKSNDCIRLLVKKGANVNRRVYTGCTPLHEAATNGSAAIVTYLLQHGGRLDVQCSSGLTPIFVAAHHGHIDVLRCMLRFLNTSQDADKDSINIPAFDNATPLLIAAQEGYADVVELLLENGADANIQVTEQSAGPLQYAIFGGHLECVQKLLPKTDRRIFSDKLHTMHPLLQALKWPNTAILQFLVDNGVDFRGVPWMDSEHSSDLLLMCDRFRHEVWRASLLCFIPTHYPLHGVKLLLEKGLSPGTYYENEEIPPLVAAMLRENFRLFRLLLLYGAKTVMYISWVDGNAILIFALHFDLQYPAVVSDSDLKLAEVEDNDHGQILLKNDEVGDDDGSGDPPNYFPLSSYAVAFASWLDHKRCSFFFNLFVAGADIKSVFQKWPSGDKRPAFSLTHIMEEDLLYSMIIPDPPQMPQEVRGRLFQAHRTALLALLICLSRNVKTAFTPDSPLLRLVSDSQAEAINSLIEPTSSLAHQCRLNILRNLCCRKGKIINKINCLNVPHTVKEYLLFPELEPYFVILSKIFPPQTVNC